MSASLEREIESLEKSLADSAKEINNSVPDNHSDKRASMSAGGSDSASTPKPASKSTNYKMIGVGIGIPVVVFAALYMSNMKMFQKKVKGKVSRNLTKILIYCAVISAVLFAVLYGLVKYNYIRM